MIGSSVDWQRVSATVLALVLTVAAWFVGVPTPARAAAVGVSFTIDSLKVGGYDKSDQVTLSGTITNTGTVNAYGVQTILWRSRDAIRTLADLRQVAEGSVVGSRMSISADHYASITSANEAFKPGETQKVSLSATIGELGFDTRGSAFAFGADVIAASDAASGNYPRVSEIRTYVAIPDRKPVPITSIVQLSAAPTKLTDDLFSSEDLTTELTGRLSALLDAAAESGRSWLIDPALLDEVRDQADGYQVQVGKGRAPGTGQAVAQAWLDRFNRLDRRDGAQSLFANLDVVGAQTSGNDQALERAERAAAEVSGLEDLPVIAVPNGGSLPAATHDFLAGAEISAVLASNTERAGALQGAVDQPPVIGTAPAVDLQQSAVLRHQLALANAVVARRAGQARLLTSQAEVAEDAATFPRWMLRRPLRELLETDPSVQRTSLLAVETSGLDRTAFARAGRVASDFADYAELAPESSLGEQSDAAVARLTSAAWITDPAGLAAQRKAYDSLVGRGVLSEAVRLEASSRWVMSSRSNQFPITVSNHLADEIEVRVVVTCDNPQRLTVPITDVVEVGAGKSVTVNIAPEATSNGVVTAEAYLASASGQRVTPDQAVTIEITDLGVVAWVIVIGSGMVLVGATIWRIRQVRRRTPAAVPATAAGFAASDEDAAEPVAAASEASLEAPPEPGDTDASPEEGTV